VCISDGSQNKYGLFAPTVGY